MVAPLKTRGLHDVRGLRKRAAHLFSLRRIREADFRFIDGRLAEVEDRIIEMRERRVEEPF